jgi:hypothetical protein
MEIDAISFKNVTIPIILSIPLVRPKRKENLQKNKTQNRSVI